MAGKGGKRKANAVDADDGETKTIVDVVAQIFLKKRETALSDSNLKGQLRHEVMYWYDLVRLINDELALLQRAPISAVTAKKWLESTDMYVPPGPKEYLQCAVSAGRHRR